MRRAKFNPVIHMSLDDAGKATGYAPKYLSFKIAPGYKMAKYMDGRRIFFLKADIEKLQKRLKRNLHSTGKHKRGKLPRKQSRSRSIRSDAGIPKSPEVELYLTPANIKQLMSSGVKMRLYML